VMAERIELYLNSDRREESCITVNLQKRGDPILRFGMKKQPCAEIEPISSLA
jgi:hypothetical protein